jgi:endonuclease/exonuclease/phosphatase family metal-dependent hydrolase
VDVYLLGVHLKCCGDPGGSEDESRQRSADAVANWLADARGVARSSGNNIVLPANTPMIVLGDFNLVGGPQPENTLLTGTIIDNATFGTDVKGDWDVSDLTNLNPLDPFTGNNFTWQGSQSFPPSALDRFMVTDSAFTVANKFVLNTNTMTPSALAAAGLQAGDTQPQNSSDHLPIILDLRVVDPCATDADSDGTPDCNDGCASDPNKTAPGICGCGVADTDSDGDETPNCNDGCPNDPNKTGPGVCGCGVPETDSDGDNTLDCNDGCPNDPGKSAPGVCGCGVSDTDSDGDFAPDCIDACPTDSLRTEPGLCGCNVSTFLQGSGDVRRDSILDGADIAAFVSELMTPSAPSEAACAADVDLSGSVDWADTEPFVTLMLEQEI